jgi:hypothetical protein
MISRPGDGERFDRENRAVTIRIDLPQLSIHELEFDTTFEVAQHAHEHVDTMYVLDGELEFLSGDEVVRARPAPSSQRRPEHRTDSATQDRTTRECSSSTHPTAGSPR